MSNDQPKNYLAEQIALKRASAKPATQPTEGATAPQSQAAAVAERMRQDQADRAAVVLFVSQIEVRKQVRTTFTNINALAQSIRELGLQQPIVVKQIDQFKYLLISGERRLRAVRDILKLDTISARIAEKAGDEEQIRLLQLTENVQREDLPPLEVAYEMAALKTAFKWRNREIADKLRVSESWVSKKLSLLDAPEAVQEKIARGELSETEYYNDKSAVAAKVKTKDIKGEGGADDVRTPMVSIPVATAQAVAELLQSIAKKTGANPIELGDKPTKKELIAILNTRVKELRKLI